MTTPVDDAVLRSIEEQMRLAIGMPVWAPDGQYHHEQVLPSGEVATHVERVADGRVSECKWTVEPGEVALVQRGRPRLLGSSVVSFDDARRTSMRVHDVLQGLPPWDDTNPDFWTAWHGVPGASVDLNMAFVSTPLGAAELLYRFRDGRLVGLHGAEGANGDGSSVPKARVVTDWATYMGWRHGVGDELDMVRGLEGRWSTLLLVQGLFGAPPHRAARRDATPSPEHFAPHPGSNR